MEEEVKNINTGTEGVGVGMTPAGTEGEYPSGKADFGAQQNLPELSGTDLVFFTNYVPSFNAKRAYLSAFPNVTNDSAMTLGSKKRRQPNIAAHIKAYCDDMRARVEEDKTLVLSVQRSLANYNVKDFLDERNEILPLKHLPDDVTVAVSGIENTTDDEGRVKIKLRFADRSKALDSLARIHKMMDNKTTVEVASETMDLLSEIMGSKGPPSARKKPDGA